MEESALVDYLCDNDLLSNHGARITPLVGGVSSDIVLVESNGNRFVVKSPLDRLRVKDEWRCSTARCITEYNAIRYAGQFFGESVPNVLYCDPEKRLFVMEYLGDEFAPWKSKLLNGEVDLAVAVRTAQLLAALHANSWQNDEVRSKFETSSLFFELRVEPYLITTGNRHPDLMEKFQSEADRLLNTRLALVHGDWSAKNILVAADRTVVLDWEVSWFGDPAFDSAFFLALLHLKSIYNRQQAREYLDLMETFRRAYAEHLPQYDDELGRRITRLTLMLLLARIDGKSPAEYITSEDTKDTVRQFTRRQLIEGIEDPEVVSDRWQKVVSST